MSPQELWQATLGELEMIISKANFTTWFKNTSISSFDGGRITISVPNVFTKEWLEKKYHQPILKAIRNVTENPSIKEIFYKIESPTQQKNLAAKLMAKEEVIGNLIADDNKIEVVFTKIGEPEVIIQTISAGGISPKYTFSNFIVGKNNELAHAAALAVSKNPGKAYNPLFIYGGSGLGKTHLMHAIGNKILAEKPGAKILYVTCEKFTNDYINAIQNGKANDFENKYRQVDILLIDDIQFISGKERTQEAFFHTFNDLHQHEKQVVISSDRPPKAIAALEHRLISRFEWGMIADISSPDIETKIAIIEAKAKERNFNLKPEIINYLAAVIQNNIRELEGALNKIIAISQLQNRELSLEDVKQIVSTLVANAQKNCLTPKNIIKIVSEYFDIDIPDIIGPCRKKNLTEPRQIIMFLMREEIKLSYPVIGQELGGRDHTTVIHACDKIIRHIKFNDKLRQDVNTLKQKIYI